MNTSAISPNDYVIPADHVAPFESKDDVALYAKLLASALSVLNNAKPIIVRAAGIEPAAIKYIVNALPDASSPLSLEGVSPNQQHPVHPQPIYTNGRSCSVYRCLSVWLRSQAPVFPGCHLVATL